MIDYRKLYSKYDKEDLINTCINLKEYKERLRKEVNKSYMICNEKDKEIERLKNIIGKLEQENAVLKTLVVNKDSYTYGVR